MSTESTWNVEIFANFGEFRVDSVDVESHSALAQATWSLSVLTEFTGSLTPHRISVHKMNKAITGIHTHLWRP
jgi:hypothetical protein